MSVEAKLLEEILAELRLMRAAAAPKPKPAPPKTRETLSPERAEAIRTRAKRALRAKGLSR